MADAYREHLFGEKTLRDLPDTPRVVFCATNLQTAALFRFSRPDVTDHQLGLADDGADPGRRVGPEVAQRLDDGVRDPIVLTDGGVYDNLGLEPVIKRCTEVLVSNGGGYVRHPERIPIDWVRHLARVTGVVDHQVRSLRKRMLVEGYVCGEYTGARWGLRSDVADYELADPRPFPRDRAVELADITTRLAGLPARDLDDLIRGRGHLRHGDAPLGLGRPEAP